MMDNKVLIVGLGQIGYNTAEYLSMKGLTVHGYDINSEVSQKALDDSVITEIARNFAGYNYYIMAISTHNPDDINKPYITGLVDVITNKIKPAATPGSVLCIDSTVPMGTCKKIAEVVHPKLCVVHCPHRFYNKEKKEHGVNQLRVLGGYKQCCVEAGEMFYSTQLEIQTHIVPSVEIAELSKLVENSYRYIQIAFAEELKIFCDFNGIDFEALRNAANTKWNCNILEARDGIGLHCLPKDSTMLMKLVSQKNCIIKTAQQIDEEYREHIKPMYKIER